MMRLAISAWADRKCCVVGIAFALLPTSVLAAQATDAPLLRAPLLHAMFSDHAVLQREAPIRVWGQAKPGEELQITFAGKNARSRADADGHWEATLPSLRAESFS